MSDVTLYHWEPNANSGKPMLALMEKGVDFNSHYVDLLNFDQHKPDYLAINPEGTIPVWSVDRTGRVDFSRPIRRLTEDEALELLRPTPKPVSDPESDAPTGWLAQLAAFFSTLIRRA